VTPLLFAGQVKIEELVVQLFAFPDAGLAGTVGCAKM
jgi:hypothetical protein